MRKIPFHFSHLPTFQFLMEVLHKSLVVLLCVATCVRNTVVFRSDFVKLHEKWQVDLSANFLGFGAGDYPFKIVFLRSLLWCRDPVVALQFLRPLRIVILCFAAQSLKIAL